MREITFKVKQLTLYIRYIATQKFFDMHFPLQLPIYFAIITHSVDRLRDGSPDQ